MRVGRRAKKRSRYAIARDRVVEPAGALVETSGFEVSITEDGSRAASPIAERRLELRERARIVFARLQNASVSIAGDSIVRIEQDRAVQCRVCRRQIVLFETAPARER